MSSRRTLLLCVIVTAVCRGALTRVDVLERSPVLSGKSFGTTGPYERVVARAYFAVDPSASANSPIADAALAPRNAKGLVEFSSDLYLLKPVDPARGNGAVLFEAPNRGQKGMLAIYNRAQASLDPRADADFGDGFLMEQGYTVVWLGWQFDVPHEQNRLRLYAPTAAGVKGLVRAEFIVDSKESERSLSDRAHDVYRALDSEMQLTVRDRIDSPRRTVPTPQWSIRNGYATRGRVRTGKDLRTGVHLAGPSCSRARTGRHS
jgi:hypothetical protein